MQTWNGIINLNKPDGWTSHDVVARVRRILGQRTVGHAGTLDPMATGVLLVCTGQATRVTEYLMSSDKVYRAVVRLGEVTDTYDATGTVVATAPVPELSAGSIEQVLATFTGDIQQLPPAYSAIKQDGVPLHRRARRGEHVELRPRPVTIRRISLLERQGSDLAIEVQCGAGTYIRSLAHDLGQSLGCGAHLTGLVRLRSGRFTLAEATTLEKLAAAAETGDLAGCLHPLTDALNGMTRVPVDAEGAARLRHGQTIPGSTHTPGEPGYAQDDGGHVVAILDYDAGRQVWRPHKVFNDD